MHQLVLLTLFVFFSKVSGILQKQGYTKVPDVDALTGLWYNYALSFILLTLYIIYQKDVAWKQLQQPNWDESKWFLGAAVFSAIYGITIIQMVKSMDYGHLLLLKAPLNMIITIAASVYILNEKITANMMISLFLYVLAVFFVSKD